MTGDRFLTPVTASALPQLVAAAGERASMRFLEFFAANIRNPHTRRAYARAADKFLAWCASAGVPSIAAVQPVHVATWIEAAPSVKHRLAAIRHLFDWLVNGQVMAVNPAHSVRGPKHVVTSGQTPMLDSTEARALLDSIDTASVVGLRLAAPRPSCSCSAAACRFASGAAGNRAHPPASPSRVSGR